MNKSVTERILTAVGATLACGALAYFASLAPAGTVPQTELRVVLGALWLYLAS